MNLIEALQEANDKSRVFLDELKETRILLGKPNDPGINLSEQITKLLISGTEQAIASGDVIEMMKAAEAHGLDAE